MDDERILINEEECALICVLISALMCVLICALVWRFEPKLLICTASIHTLKIVYTLSTFCVNLWIRFHGTVFIAFIVFFSFINVFFSSHNENIHGV